MADHRHRTLPFDRVTIIKERLTSSIRSELPTAEVTIIAKLPATIALAIPEGETHEFAVPRQKLRYFDADTGLKRAP